MEQDAPGASGLAQVVEPNNRNGPAGVMAESIDAGLVPTFATETTALVTVPSPCAPKATAAGARSVGAPGGGDLPVPLRLTGRGLPAALWVMASCADLGPAARGVNVTCARQRP